VVLSARNEARLYEQVRQLLAWVQLERQDERPLGQAQDRCEARSLQNMAYTLQVGREAMEERLALQVSSLVELEEQLCRFLQEPKEGGSWYRGQVKRHKETMVLLSNEEELQEAMQEAIDRWLQRGKYEKLLSWWVKGLNSPAMSRMVNEMIDILFPQKVHLPSYLLQFSLHLCDKTKSITETHQCGRVHSL